jgi:hypothetical protein
MHLAIRQTKTNPKYPKAPILRAAQDNKPPPRFSVDHSPEAKLTAGTAESQFDFKKRQQIAFEGKQKDSLKKLIQALEE